MKYLASLHNQRKILRTPDLYEYFIDNYWFKTNNMENQRINEPLRDSQKADTVIVRGGYTGLSSAYHLRKGYHFLRLYFQKELAADIELVIGVAASTDPRIMKA